MRRETSALALALGTVAFANGAAAHHGTAVGGGAAAAAAGVGRTSKRGPPLTEFVGEELRDWVDLRTGSTTALAAGCGHVVELRLRGTGTTNFLVLTTANESGNAAWIDSSSIMGRLGKGPWRRLHTPDDGGEVAVAHGWWANRIFAFPRKQEFQGSHELSVVVPFSWDGGSCTVGVEIVRPPGSEDPATYLPHGRYEIYAGAGLRFAATSNLGRLGGNGTVDFQFGLGLYPWFHHGLFFDIVADPYGSRGARVTAPTRQFQANPDVTAIGFFPTYTFRLLPASWLAVSYWASVGPYIFQLTDGSGSNNHVLSKAIFAVRERLRVAAPFLRVPQGTGISLAGSVVHTYVPHGSFGDAPLSGSAFGWLAELVVDG